MYKPILIISVLFFYLNISAQVTYDEDGNFEQQGSSIDFSKMSFGLKISPTVSWINVVNTNMQADGAALKFGVGGVLSYELLPNFSLVSGVNYNSYGGYVYDNESLNNTVFRNNYRVDYTEIEVPIALKLKTKTSNKMAYFLQGGFSAGFINNSTEKRIPLAQNAKPVYTDISLMTNPTRLNCLFGAGVEYSLGKKTNLFGLISYKNSLTNQANSISYADRYNSLLQMYPGSMEFSVGIMF
ncbi:MAG TPA: porin family protein [Paludibacter sp.]|nr:porin family protein [Paludibacter sp.]